MLGAAEQTDTVAAVAAWESAGSNEAFSADGMADLGRFGAAMEQVGVVANDGRLDDARCAPSLSGSAPTRRSPRPRWHRLPPALGRWCAGDAGLLIGAETLLPTMFGNVARFVNERVADAQVREVAGAGHFAPVVAPQVVAEELTSFFETALQLA